MSSNSTRPKSQELASSSSHMELSANQPEGPILPPGLMPLPDERLWHPHDDQYWQHLREMWGSRPESPEPGFKQDNLEEEDMEDIDLRSANERTFRIALRARIAAQTAEANRSETNQDNTSSQGDAQSTPSSSSQSFPDDSRNKSSPEYTPAPVSVATGKGRRAFRGVQITTITRTYGDFTSNNPPPYTPKPTGDERSFNIPPLENKPTQKKKWPVAKYLFICGFFFPLCWIFGAMLLLGGLRKMCSDAHVEQGGSSNKFEAPTEDGTVAQRIAAEVRWAKRCAWATAAAVCLMVIAFFIIIFVVHTSP